MTWCLHFCCWLFLLCPPVAQLLTIKQCTSEFVRKPVNFLLEIGLWNRGRVKGITFVSLQGKNYITKWLDFEVQKLGILRVIWGGLTSELRWLCLVGFVNSFWCLTVIFLIPEQTLPCGRFPETVPVLRTQPQAETRVAIPISKAYCSSLNIVDITKNWNQQLRFRPFIWASTSLLRRKLNTAPLWKFPSDIEAYLCIKEIKTGRQVLEKELETGNVLPSPILEPRIWPRCRGQSVVVNSVSWSLCPESTEGCGSPLTDSKAVLRKEDCLGCPHFLWLCWFSSHKTKQKLPLLIEEWMNKTCYICTMDFFIQKNKIMSFSKR